MTAPLAAGAGAHPPRTLVVRLDSAGDVLLAGPAIRAAAAGSSTVALLCGPLGEAAGRLLPGVDRVLVYDAPWVRLAAPELDPAEVTSLVRRLAADRYDRALILASHHQSPLPAALLLKLAGVPWIAADSEHYPGSLLQLRHQRAPYRHEAAAALELTEAAGFRLPEGDGGELRVRRPPDTTALTGAGPYLVVHPGASVPSRTWSAERAARAVAALGEAGHRVVVTGGPDEAALTRRVAGRHALDLGGRTELPELAGVLRQARLVIVGNTGPAHLAAAVRTPVISLFSPVVSADRWLPYQVPHLLLGQQDSPCAGTRARECPVPGHPCLDSITDEEVLAAVARLTVSGPPCDSLGRKART
ncbi:glycosyltransferase family 9 protein [Streptomyces millisiae]|uniref:Glycosyltransferase family 9 protein n=1 Tax=Streptomyces millisiae TaxID=3075542 RepID=A0ABU2LIQ0_9ACTN|nr:glycosyltransferase family 9 protein [Streptomyces sp. DSM 44918]MDT0317401.1 glycosyltransferase family 9 protein [Streptomyces sp. DSM 44918]